MIWTTQPRSEVPGGLAARQIGDGPPLILIHGVGLRAEAWAGVMPQLSAQFAVSAVDMPGHGGSPLGKARELTDYVSRFVDYVQSLDQRVFVAGHSMGALIALELAAQFPDRVAGVAALNAIYRRTPDAALAVQARANALNAEARASAEPTLERWFGRNPTVWDADAANACRTWLNSVDLEGYAAAYRIFAYHDGPDDMALKNLRMPVIFQTGSHDPNSTPEMSKTMASLAPVGRADVVAGAAHMMPMTHPGAVANALLHAFGVTK
mgnify:FL=1